MSARIIVTLICEYTGDDVNDYDDAMTDAAMRVSEASEDIKIEYPNLRVVEVQVSG